MPAKLDASGDIEVICNIHDLAPGKMARIVFRAFDDATPPFKIRIRAPSGATILERVIRDLPTGGPQSPPPITFAVAKGEYHILITDFRGNAEGGATLVVS
ncbi:MAG: hypothetical protein HY908_24190 [Myxococcales bacterium]|nr:hypothetical protein [Myxococcales bacterium]